MRFLQFGPIGGLTWRIYPSALVGTLMLVLLLSGAAFWGIDMSMADAVLTGVFCTALFWLSDLVHNYGHAFAARRMGHPMIGIRFFWILGANVYPSNESELPPRVHILRALGGPIANALLSVVAGLIWLAVRGQGEVIYWSALWFFLLNVFFYTLQVFAPLGFNDGAVIWKYLPQLRKREIPQK
jgi:hypothetical protein